MPSNGQATTILGIDPGSQITGVGVIMAQGSELKHIYSESLKLPKGELSLRLREIYTRLQLRKHIRMWW